MRSGEAGAAAHGGSAPDLRLTAIAASMGPRSNLAHQPADVLTLAREAAASVADALGFANGGIKVFRQAQCLKLGGLEVDQLLAELLSRMRGTLARALARAQLALQALRILLFAVSGRGSHGRLHSVAGCDCYNSAPLRARPTNFMTQAVAGSRIAELQDVVSLALEEARKRGATPMRGGREPQSRPHCPVRLGEVETIEYQRDRGLA